MNAALIKQLRAILLERGIVAPQGKRKLEQFLVNLMDEQGGAGLSPRMIMLVTDTRVQWAELDRRIAAFDAEFIRWTKENEDARRLATIPGVGATIASALIAAVGKAETFERGRDLAAWLRIKIRDEGLVRNKAVYVALGVRADGTKEILGLRLEQNEGAKFWLRVMNELKTRGVEDILVAIVDGLKGFPEAIVAVFPEATVQTCIVHLLRHSLEFASYKDRKAVAAALKNIYRAIDAASGEAALAAFEASPWGRKYPAIGQSWRRAWPEVVPFYAFHPDVRRLVYTTNAIEALNSKLRRAVRGIFQPMKRR